MTTDPTPELARWGTVARQYLTESRTVDDQPPTEVIDRDEIEAAYRAFIEAAYASLIEGAAEVVSA